MAQRKSDKFPALTGILIVFFIMLFPFTSGGSFDIACVYAQAVPQEKEANCPEREALLKEMSSLIAENKVLENHIIEVNILNRQLEDKAKGLYLKFQESQDIKNEKENTKEIISGLNKERVELKKKNEALREKVDVLEETLKEERTSLYLELGLAYGSAGNFEKAIDSYNQALKYGTKNTRAYYYLGLLYKHHLNDSEKAKDNFKKYLEYNPNAEDKGEVEYLIKLISDS